MKLYRNVSFVIILSLCLVFSTPNLAFAKTENSTIETSANSGNFFSRFIFPRFFGFFSFFNGNNGNEKINKTNKKIKKQTTKKPLCVPEFGAIPAAIAAITSAGSFYLLKRKNK